MRPLPGLLTDIRRCSLCKLQLPCGPRPVVQASVQAPVLIVGQAPGRRVHASGKPFDDLSGDRLRGWLGVNREQFYNPALFSIAPMGFCYPGTGKGGDLPPRPECADTWRAPLMQSLTGVKTIIVLGQYAIRWHFPKRYRSVTEAVEDWESYWPSMLALPHPSPRNMRWFQRNAWFEQDIIPALQQRVKDLLINLPSGN